MSGVRCSHRHRGSTPERGQAREAHRLDPDLISAYEHIRQPVLVIWLGVIGSIVRAATLASFERTTGREFGHLQEVAHVQRFSPGQVYPPVTRDCELFSLSL